MATRHTEDDRGTVQKAMDGDFASMDLGDAANAGQLASGPLLGAVTKSMPIMGAANTAITGVASFINSDKEAQRLARMFSKGSLRTLVRQNPALRKKYSQLDEQWQGDMVGAGFSMAAGAAGGALVGFLIPVLPFGLIIGSIAGGMLGNKLYQDAFVEQAQDPILMNAQLVKMSENGEPLAVEAVFATLAANLNGKDGKMIGKLLKKYTGTDKFTEALADPKNIPKLQAMMNNPVVDDAIRAKTGMPRDAANPMKSVSEQYAELLNSGQMQAKNMLNTGEGMYALAAMERGGSYNVDVPMTPTRSNARDRS